MEICGATRRNTMPVENKETDYVRQVIVVRTDLSMPRGKIAAMAAHASMTFIAQRFGDWEYYPGNDAWFPDADGYSTAEKLWLTELEPGSDDQLSFAKIVCGVDTEAELQYLFEEAVDHGLVVQKVIDGGYSHNKPGTFVAIAIGPDYPDNLNPVTGKLKLYR